MSGLIDKRKRSREDDVSCESTPLSKRINNLHLSTFEEAQFNHQPHNDHHPNIYNNHMFRDVMTASAEPSVIKSTAAIEPDKNMYDPELNESENPFYYIENKLLHDLHLERLKRCTV